MGYMWTVITSTPEKTDSFLVHFHFWCGYPHSQNSQTKCLEVRCSSSLQIPWCRSHCYLFTFNLFTWMFRLFSPTSNRSQSLYPSHWHIALILFHGQHSFNYDLTLLSIWSCIYKGQPWSNFTNELNIFPVWIFKSINEKERNRTVCFAVLSCQRW